MVVLTESGMATDFVAEAEVGLDGLIDIVVLPLEVELTMGRRMVTGLACRKAIVLEFVPAFVVLGIDVDRMEGPIGVVPD